MRWEKGSDGRLRLVAGDPTPEEAAEGEARLTEMLEARQPPAADIWKPESTIHSMGREVSSRKTFKEELAKRGLVEVSKSEIGNVKKVRPTLKEMAKKAVDDARAFLQETGQYVSPGTPTTERTKERIAQGKPILDVQPPSPEAPSDARVDTPAGPGVPWGYVGDKEDYRAIGISSAISRASKEGEVRPI